MQKIGMYEENGSVYYNFREIYIKEFEINKEEINKNLCIKNCFDEFKYAFHNSIMNNLFELVDLYNFALDLPTRILKKHPELLCTSDIKLNNLERKFFV